MKDEPKVEAPNCVTIFGAGIAGLTVAHELVERGFRVQVWEKQADERYPYGGCDVGGMARTQWSRVPWPGQGGPTDGEAQEQPIGRSPSLEPFEGRGTQKIQVLPQTFFLMGEASAPVIHGFDQSGAANEEGFKYQVNDAYESLAKNSHINFVYCEVQRRRGAGDALDQASIDAAVDAFNAVIGTRPEHPWITQEKKPSDYRWHVMFDLSLLKERNVRVAVVTLDGFPTDVPSEYHTRLSFRVRERWIPGEHGFRFFPAFYHHLFDTMKRTPILELAPKSPVGAAQERSVTVNADPQKYVESSRTAFDNLHPTTKTALGMTRDGRPQVESRFAPVSLEDIRQWLRIFFGSNPDDHSVKTNRHRRPEGTETDDGGGFGCTFRDAAIYQIKVLKYLTSCQKRREEYEHMSWLDFLGGEAIYSPNFVRMTNRWPEALVAMSATQIDARSQGSASVQFLLENFQPPGYRDGTLMGPTSVSWFQHWRRYLEAQGVEFIHGELKGLELRDRPDGGGKRPWPVVDCYEPRYPMNDKGQPDLMPGYFVLALPVTEASRVSRKFVALEEASGRTGASGFADLHAIAKLLPKDLDLGQPQPNGPLRHMVGVQFYFDKDLSWFDGHIYFPNSAWGISGISQIRFWQDRPDWEHGYRGILSAIFSMTIDGKPNTKAWESSKAEIAQTVWDQIKADLPDLPDPIHWHVDANLEFDEDHHGAIGNKSPYLINPPNAWAKRPGRVNLPPSAGIANPDAVGYEVSEGLVLAGTFMQTTTRLTTMEAANESGRHAVNGILWDRQRAGADAEREGQEARSGPKDQQTFCDIWPLEDREVDDFRFLKDLDAELYSRGLDHFVDILELDTLAANFLRGGPNDPLDPLGILRGLQGLIARYGEALIQTPNDPK